MKKQAVNPFFQQVQGSRSFYNFHQFVQPALFFQQLGNTFHCIEIGGSQRRAAADNPIGIGGLRKKFTSVQRNRLDIAVYALIIISRTLRLTEM